MSVKRTVVRTQLHDEATGRQAQHGDGISKERWRSSNGNRAASNDATVSISSGCDLEHHATPIIRFPQIGQPAVGAATTAVAAANYHSGPCATAVQFSSRCLILTAVIPAKAGTQTSINDTS